MTSALLDTHTLVWLMLGNPILGAGARRMANDALNEQSLYVSTISFWEVAMLAQRGSLPLARTPLAWRRDVVGLGIIEVPVTGEIAILAAELQDFHRDPADRIIAATAQLQGAVLLTADARILGWKGQLERHNARR